LLLYNKLEHQPSRIAEKHRVQRIRDFNNCAKCHRSGIKNEIDDIIREYEIEKD
jgi:hypothetical protein